MTDRDEDLLIELLLRWEELQEQGQEIPASELCQDHPHLVDELTRRIHALNVTSWLDKRVSDPEAIAPAKSPSDESRTLTGRYRLDDLIAEGGFAQVWRGYDLELQRIVAVKLPKPSRVQSAESYLAEARRVAQLKHPGIVPVFDVGRSGDVCFIVSEFVEGGSLGDHLAKNPVPQQQAAQWIAEVADALDYAHRHGVIHRDIKPANILIDHHNRALLADFGIAQSSESPEGQALPIGTLRYMSPKQLEGKGADVRSDIYSLGIVLHEVVTGKLPYSSDDPNVLRREICTGVTLSSALAADLRPICRKALDPATRYSTAAQLAADLRRLSKGSSSKTSWIAAALAITLIIGIGWPFLRSKFVPNDLKIDPVGEIPESSPEKEVTPKPVLTVEALLEAGNKLFEQNFFDGAAEKFTEAIALEPNNAEPYDRRGACAQNSGAFKQSLADFSKAIELDPTKPEFLHHRAFAYASLRNFDLGIADLKQALTLNPTDPLSFQKTLAIIYSNRALERFNAMQFAEAADDVTQAIKHFPQGDLFYHQRGSCYFNLKDYEKAAADFTESIRREPEKGAHYLHRGNCFQSLGREAEAAADFEKAKMLGNAP